jgi:hypothetical protein
MKEKYIKPTIESEELKLEMMAQSCEPEDYYSEGYTGLGFDEDYCNKICGTTISLS